LRPSSVSDSCGGDNKDEDYLLCLCAEFFFFGGVLWEEGDVTQMADVEVENSDVRVEGRLD
jgi:hypothetical protein